MSTRRVERREFIESLIEQIRHMDISNIIGAYIPLIQRGRHFMNVCPFHNDTKLGSFKVTPGRGIYKCFSCGAGGDAIRFVADYKGMSYTDALEEIALDHRLITPDEYEIYFEGKRYTQTELSAIKASEKRYIELDKLKSQDEIASDDVLHKVYSLFLESATLTEEHQEYLKKERFLSEEEIIKGGYKTFPTRHIMARESWNAFPKELKSFTRLLEESNMEEDILMYIPGFYREQKGEEWKWTFFGAKGIIIPVRNELGQIIRLQIRKDVVREEESRYSWFSSSFAKYDEKFQFGVSAGAPMAVIYPEVIKNRTIVITEGIFKADVIAKELGSVVISVQGVSNWRTINKLVNKIQNSGMVEERIVDKLKGKIFPNQFYVMYDSDMAYKFQVYEQLKNMSDLLENSFGAQVEYVYWDKEDCKGFDDLVHSTKDYKQYINKYKKIIFDELYLEMKQAIFKNLGVQHLKDVSQEVLKGYVTANVVGRLKVCVQKVS